MLVAHTLGLERIVVDNTSLLLLLIILLSPLVAAVKKIKVGDFEAEIASDEVKQITEQAEKSLATTPATPKTTPGASETSVDEIKNLLESDPVMALAKLRFELESRLRRLHNRTNGQTEGVRVRSTGRIIRDLAASEVFASDFGVTLQSVIAVCNRAVHGEDIRDVDAKKIVETGSELLEVLDQIARDYAVTHPAEKTVITVKDRDEFQQARYRLTTVVPYVENPERRVYLVDQSELDAFFDGYSEFGELVIGLERIQ